MDKNVKSSTDGRNEHNIVQICKRKYLEQYGTITNSNISIEEFNNKHGQTYFSVNIMVNTCTVKSILQQLTEPGVTASYEAVLSLRSFSITFVTEKEIALCCCKLS